MLNKKIYGYSSIRTGHTKKELQDNFENTKLYSDYINIVKVMKINMVAISNDEITPDYRLIEDNMTFDSNKMLQVDVMTSKRDNMHYKLDCIIKQSNDIHEKRIEPLPEQERKKIGKEMNTVIILNSISALGNCEDIKKYYSIFKQDNIGIVIPDYTRDSSLSEYSTCDFAFSYRCQSELNRAYDLVERLEQSDIPDNRGRVGKDFTDSFRVAFWLYELFKIPEKIAVAMSGFSKNGFHQKADSYEQTQNYKEELKTMDQMFGISKLIKRNRPVPENFDKLNRQYEKRKKNLELACIICKIPIIFPIDYQRLQLKADGGKKELARCLKLYDENLIADFDEWVKNGNSPTDYYQKCDMEQYLYNTADIF